jgi:hypothetical protein
VGNKSGHAAISGHLDIQRLLRQRIGAPKFDRHMGVCRAHNHGWPVYFHALMRLSAAIRAVILLKETEMSTTISPMLGSST